MLYHMDDDVMHYRWALPAICIGVMLACQLYIGSKAHAPALCTSESPTCQLYVGREVSVLVILSARQVC